MQVSAKAKMLKIRSLCAHRHTWKALILVWEGAVLWKECSVRLKTHSDCQDAPCVRNVLKPKCPEWTGCRVVGGIGFEPMTSSV